MSEVTRPQRVLVLGSTGSVGTQALDLLAQHPDRFELVGITAGSNRALLAQQSARFPAARTALGIEGAIDLIHDVAADVILNAITGSVGLSATLAALDTPARLALANKESLVVGGALVREKVRPGQLLPVDSEHCAILQTLRAGTHNEVRRLIVTASGGPFRGRPRDSLGEVTPADALAHPTWNMGRVITTNSATLVNKGLEVIEAHLLFDIDYDAIDVVVHPQSIVHSMVEFIDGSTIAQASVPDMRLAIALGLDPNRRMQPVTPMLDWTTSSSWTFEPLDNELFPAVELAKQVGKAGATYPAVYNAANEVAVHAFHDRAISFLSIVEIVQRVVEVHDAPGELTLESLADSERWARAEATALVS
ncbi:1-deoxy-D-xylulose-5-phosphate reductoisomerase [Nesterenkonia sandarakina]|uniref:1-deoxy-D-xylulose 5-phosphate reductoisomerase n=1 Tax=Nesterenkonia sandarakina TaxID=272918 RepID=A0A7Z0E5U8_9MICC|nr:1-deoxy-D-xylulose-5-phosphate reductoisomerase [Nesterenkonia sandarakina]